MPLVGAIFKYDRVVRFDGKRSIDIVEVKEIFITNDMGLIRDTYVMLLTTLFAFDSTDKDWVEEDNGHTWTINHAEISAKNGLYELTEDEKEMVEMLKSTKKFGI
jgi:hypothetical protein